jgi:hypothetical protein
MGNFWVTPRIIFPRISKGNGFDRASMRQNLRRIVIRRPTVENAPTL